MYLKLRSAAFSGVWKHSCCNPHLLLLSGFQNLFCAAHQLILVFDLLFQKSHSHLQLAHQTLFLMDLCVQSAVLSPQRQDLLLWMLALLHIWQQENNLTSRPNFPNQRAELHSTRGTSSLQKCVKVKCTTIMIQIGRNWEKSWETSVCACTTK